jgi:hypothetical protein
LYQGKVKDYVKCLEVSQNVWWTTVYTRL